jgi:hypothetical protein
MNLRYGVLKFGLAAALAVSIVSVQPTVARAELDMREGSWETTTEVNMESMPQGFSNAMKSTYCMTKKDLLPKASDKDKNNCTVKEQNVSGNTVRWHIICVDNGTTSDGKGEITYSGASYKGVMDMTVTGRGEKPMHMSMKYSGKYLGPCTEEDKKRGDENKKRVDDYKKQTDDYQKQAADARILHEQQIKEQQRLEAERAKEKARMDNEQAARGRAYTAQGRAYTAEGRAYTAEGRAYTAQRAAERGSSIIGNPVRSLKNMLGF